MDRTVVLVGNPNVGKSVIFNRLTGRYAVVSNYPGTTVDLSRGVAIIGGQNVQVIDTPGTNSLTPVSEDEQVTRDVLFREKPHAVIQVADAKNLQRTLLLTMELLELNIPMVLVLNMSDEARERGIRIDRAAVEKLLGIPVIETVGTTGEGVAELKKRMLHPRAGSTRITYSQDIENLIGQIVTALPDDVAARRMLALMLASGDASARRYVAVTALERIDKLLAQGKTVFPKDPQLLFFNRRRSRADEIIGVVANVEAKQRSSRLARLGELCMRPFPGYLAVFAVLFVMYEFVGVFAAGFLVNFFEKIIFGRYINPQLVAFVDRAVAWPLLRDFLVGPYGLITMALTYALAIVLPIVSAFFFFFGFLEDSGYLPRLSVMLDRVFRRFGLNGKAVLPMVLGLGCGTMAALGSRILETRKERLLVILLLSLTIPCSAQLGVILGLLAGLSWKVTALWLLSITGSLFLVGSAADRLLPGVRSPFVLEIPPLRRPSLGNILSKVKMRLLWYLREAVPLFILGTTILFVVDRARLLGLIERLARPFVVHLLGLPVQVTPAFIIGFMRRDYGAAGLYVLARDGILDPRQILVSIVTMTLFVPCIAQCFMVVREQGLRIALLIFIFVSLYAFLFGGFLNYTVIALHLL